MSSSSIANYQFKSISPPPKRNYRKLYAHRANIFSFDEDKIVSRRRFNQFSNKTFETSDVEDVLLGKKGIEALNITSFAPMNFKETSTLGSPIRDGQSFWSSLLNYTEGKRRNTNIQSLISQNLLK